MFPDAPSIAPYLEHPKTGPTASFCAELARRLECFVVAGYPECLESFPAAVPTSSPSSSDTAGTDHKPPPDALIGANAALLYDPTGHLCHTYHKSNLFPTDLTWARPGPGFTALDLPAPLGRLGMAICNDVNVKAGEAWDSIEGGPYELAGWCKGEGVRVLVLLNAWLRGEDGGMEGVEEGESGGGDAGRGGEHDRDRDRVGGQGEAEEEDCEAVEGGLEPNWEVLNYWAMRLRPLWATSVSNPKEVDKKTDAEGGTGQSDAPTKPVITDEQQEVIVIACNRFGRERGAHACFRYFFHGANTRSFSLYLGKTFAGSSAMFSMRAGSGRPRLLHFMGEREEGVSVWTVRAGSQTLSSGPAS